VSGVDAVSVDTLVTSSPENGWPPCPECVTIFATSLRHETGPITDNDLINALGPGEVDRWIVVETDRGTVLLNPFSASERDFRRFMPIFQEVIDSVQISS
jgi:hypothetical protein